MSPCFHYPCHFVSSLLKNSKGDEIIFPVNDDRDRQWARRLDWVVERHLDRAEDELEELHADYIGVDPRERACGGTKRSILLISTSSLRRRIGS